MLTSGLRRRALWEACGTTRRGSRRQAGSDARRAPRAAALRRRPAAPGAGEAPWPPPTSAAAAGGRGGASGRAGRRSGRGGRSPRRRCAFLARAFLSSASTFSQLLSSASTFSQRLGRVLGCVCLHFLRWGFQRAGDAVDPKQSPAFGARRPRRRKSPALLCPARVRAQAARARAAAWDAGHAGICI